MKPEQPNGSEKTAGAEARRRSLLDLAPLELRCMNALWPLGEGTVREIRDLLAPRLPRAYTTIMTIMDRLARKGIVERKKAGRAYVYRPCLTLEDARSHALVQVVEGFFEGSREMAAAYLRDGRAFEAQAQDSKPRRAAAAAAGAGATRTVAASVPASPHSIVNSPAPAEAPTTPTKKTSTEVAAPIDATLL
jgi:BlaI family transcriptional regulator, penicillinase repressor